MFSERPCTEDELLPSGTETVYLDTNVLVGLFDGRLEKIKQHLLRLVSKGQLICPFTAEQVDEFVIPIRSIEERMQRLMMMSNLSIDRYYRSTPVEVGFCHRSPFEVYDDISKTGFTRFFQEYLSNLFPIETMRVLQQEYGIEPGAMANKEADFAINYIDEKLKSYEPKGSSDVSSRATSLEETLQLLINILKTSSPSLLKTNGTRIVLLFSLLDSFGYRSDSSKEYRKGSRFPDARHVSLAADFDCLVSNDQKMIEKAGAVYRFLDIPISTFNSSEFELHVRSF